MLVNFSSTDFVIFLVCRWKYTTSCFLNSKKNYYDNLQLSQLFKEKIVIKTIEISFKISSQIQPPSKSILNPVSKNYKKLNFDPTMFA